MKRLLTITAIFEGFTGLGLVVIPATVVSILLGSSLTDPNAILICRLTGGALLTIAFACSLLRHDPQSSVMVKVMFGYNIFTLALLVYGAIAEKIYGPGLWPSAFVHLVFFIWCSILLRKRILQTI